MAKIPARTRIEDLRRRELIAAAHRAFMQHGLGGMTTKRICEEAGMSPGILSYYFKGKDDVLFAMVRLNNRLLVEDVVVRLNQSVTRWDRLLAVIEGNFPAAVYERNVATAWLSVVAASPGNPRYARLQSLFYARMRSNLASAFAGILPPARLATVARTIMTLVDGLWLQKSAGEVVSRDEAVTLIVTAVAALLSEGERAALQSR